MSEEFTAEAVAEIATVSADEWDACAGTGHPFTRHAFLSALEASGSVCAKTGWLPQHLLLRDGGGTLLAAMPCYLKSHSYGEYVFDHAWADAFERAGGRYYPKLQSAVPFTPVTGPRLLVRPTADRDDMQSRLFATAVALTRQHEASSLHVTFLTAPEASAAERAGLLLRTDQQFHWYNDGFDSFEDFLSSLASRKRKQIKKERREALEDGITVDWLRGAEITEADWDRFFAFYLDTGARKWGRPYLNRDFFSRLSGALGDQVVLMLARREGAAIAGALNFAGSETLYGRYWGCVEDNKFLHFELCYYQAIDYAIAHGLSRVEAGAQGPHKLARGYTPAKTYSAHWLANAGFSEAVAQYLKHEREDTERAMAMLARHTPFKKEG